MESSTGFTAATGQTQFLELFIAQIQNQDPLQPTEQTEFLSQLAQFSTVEGLESLNQKQDTFQATFEQTLQLQQLNSGSELLGKSVTWGPGEATGVATEIRQEAGQVLVNVGGNLVPIVDITSVSEATDSQT